jgi:hypothetical protein
VLEEAHYQHILNVINNMTLVMERSPTAFQEMGEENIRQHYLVQLNGHFSENKQMLRRRIAKVAKPTGSKL